MGSDWHVLVCEVEDRLALTATAESGFYKVTGTRRAAVIAIRSGFPPTATVIERSGDPVDAAWSQLSVYGLLLRVTEPGVLIPRARNEGGGLDILDLGVVERIVRIVQCDPLHRRLQ
ncbi:hypothetical protein [Cryobacterium sp. SO1]|uniref:hypothetical protein n=1 Tax=Cryobacterium sp. SO1 TaxID=1897061 RepID=UPI001023B527|nr:hypothetical protein [Cryobacterium sp. SO1]RZI36976.1 hypothetical protein BJQ95_00643 [Cryobacterium sp. SO1]